VTRARSLFFGFLAAAVALFAFWKRVSASPHEIGSALALVSPCLFVVAVACAAAAWGTAVMVASVHRVTWPLVTAVCAVVAGLAVAFWL